MRTSRKTMPLRSTTTEKKRPMSLLKVMSPKPSVDTVTGDPVEAAEPGVVPPSPRHDGEVEEDGKNDDERNEDDDEPAEETEVAANVPDAGESQFGPG